MLNQSAAKVKKKAWKNPDQMFMGPEIVEETYQCQKPILKRDRPEQSEILELSRRHKEQSTNLPTQTTESGVGLACVAEA